jgi:hypothetical protein
MQYVASRNRDDNSTDAESALGGRSTARSIDHDIVLSRKLQPRFLKDVNNVLFANIGRTKMHCNTQC